MADKKIFFVSPEKSIRRILEDIKKVENIEHFIIQLLPGTYQEDFILPSFVSLRGYGKDNTKIIITKKLELESDSQIMDVTLEYINAELLEELEIIYINCQDYKLSFMKDNQRQYSNEVIISNVNINIYNFISGNVIYLLSGNLRLDKVRIHSNILLEDEKLSVYNNILFRIGYFCSLLLIDTEIDYETMLDNSFIFYSELSRIEIKNSQIRMNSKLDNNNTYLFFNTYSHLQIQYSRLENNIKGGQIIFLNTDEELITSDTISNIRIENQTLYIRSFLPDYICNKIILFMKGIIYDGETYIFSNKKELEECIVIDLHLTGSTKEVEYELEPFVEYLFGIDIQDSFLLENSVESFYESQNFDNYLLQLSNLNLQYKNFNSHLTSNLKHSYSWDNIEGKFSVPLLESHSFPENTFQSLFSNKIGFSLLPKEKIGYQTVDLSFGELDICSEGKNAFTTGYHNQSFGDYSTTLGYNNKTNGDYSLTCGQHLENNFSYSLCLGKYNNKEYDIINKVLVVGNGSAEKRKDAFIVYENGTVLVEKKIQAPEITTGIISMLEGNISNVENMEIINNLYVDEDVYVEGEIKGQQLNTVSNVINIGGEVITTLKINLSNYMSPHNYGGIIYPEKEIYGSLLDLKETINGLVYQVEITCISAPNRGDIRFFLCNIPDLKRGFVLEKLLSYDMDNTIYLTSNYEWKKGSRLVIDNKIQTEMDYDGTYSLYLARETEKTNQTELTPLLLSGKFLVRIYGTEVF